MPPKEPVNRKSKLYNSRTIRTESSEPSLHNGILNASEFISSREFEIRAFEQSQLKTKSASSSRIFQSLPRTLRRRTASHNVKRMPKRLRARALREMKSSGYTATPIRRITGWQLHKMRMMKKVFQMAARLRELRAPVVAEGTITKQLRSLNKQLKVAKRKGINYSNSCSGNKDLVGNNSICQRPTGGIIYGTRQRKFTWTPNHIWHAKRFHMMKRWGWHIPYSPNQKCFRSTSRACKELALLFETSYYNNIVINCSNAANVTTFLNKFTRYSGKIPEWFQKGKKAYNGWLYLNDQRSAMVSICHNTRAFNLLVRVHAADFAESFEAFVSWAEKLNEVDVYDCRYAIGSLELRGPLSIHCLSKVFHPTQGSMLPDEWKICGQNADSNVIESGHMFSFFVRDPRYWKQPIKPPTIEGELSSLLVEKSLEIRREDEKVQSSHSKALSELLLHEKREDLYFMMDTVNGYNKSWVHKGHHGNAHFPVVTYKLENGAWCVNVPWFWVQPLWIMLNKVKGLKIAGYRQMHQLNSEMLKPTYPYDYPFTSAGYKEHQLNVTSNLLALEKLPSSKRNCLEKTEGKILPGCDWFFLRKWIFGLQLLKNLESSKNKQFSSFGEFDAEHKRILRTSEDLALIIESTRSQSKDLIPIALLDLLDPMHKVFISGTFKPDISKFPPLPVVQVALEPVKGGLIKDNARVYSNEAVLDFEGLIGFVSTSAYNIRLGNPSAIAIISANCKDMKRVFVRNLGCTTAYAYKVTVL